MCRSVKIVFERQVRNSKYGLLITCWIGYVSLTCKQRNIQYLHTNVYSFFNNSYDIVQGITKRKNPSTVELFLHCLI